MKAIINNLGRIECGGIEFKSGDDVEVKKDNEWYKTTIEHDGIGYYSIDGYDLVGYPVRRVRYY